MIYYINTMTVFDTRVPIMGSSFTNLLDFSAASGFEVASSLMSKLGIRSTSSNPPDDDSLNNKTVVITGGNRGIGLEVVKEFSKRGAKIIMGVRDTKSGEDVISQVLPKIMQGKKIDVKVMKLDLSSFKSVNEFSDAVNQSVERIDILVNNAGLMSTKHRMTSEGFESNFGVNYLSHFLLTMNLLNMLKLSPLAKIISVGSIAHLCE